MTSSSLSIAEYSLLSLISLARLCPVVSGDYGGEHSPYALHRVDGQDLMSTVSLLTSHQAHYFPDPHASPSSGSQVLGPFALK